MASRVDVYNMALGHCGNSSTIASDEERSPERVICARFWDTALDSLLSWKSADWRFAQTSVLLADLGSPPTNWAYRYRYPNDCLRAMYLVVPGLRNPPNNARPVFEVGYEDSARVILTDQPAAELRYIKRITAVERLPAPVVHALSLWLAYFVCMPLMKDNGLKRNLLEEAERACQEAMAYVLNEQQPDLEPDSAYIQEMRG